MNDQEDKKQLLISILIFVLFFTPLLFFTYLYQEDESNQKNNSSTLSQNVQKLTIIQQNYEDITLVLKQLVIDTNSAARQIDKFEQIKQQIPENDLYKLDYFQQKINIELLNLATFKTSVFLLSDMLSLYNPYDTTSQQKSFQEYLLSKPFQKKIEALKNTDTNKQQIVNNLSKILDDTMYHLGCKEQDEQIICPTSN